MKKTPNQLAIVRKTVRLPEAVAAGIEAAAKYNGRTVNAEILARLEIAETADQFGRVFRELSELKALEREILDIVADRRRA